MLDRPLHHEPTKGGPAEAEKHLAMYAETLAAYREAFGTEPPADIWTAADERFGDDLKHRAVNTARNWVIPKAPVKRAAQLAALFTAITLFVPGCNGGLNPFALVGSDFLYFLIPMMLAAVCLGRLIGASKRGPEPREEDDNRELTWEQSAYLAGGSARLTTAAIARLVSSGVAAVEGKRLVRGGREVADGITPVEMAVRNALPFSNDATSIKPVAQAVEAAFADEGKKLEEEGYLMSKGAWVWAGFLAILPLLVVQLGFALPRFVMAVINHKPVEYLVLTAIFGTAIGIAITLVGLRRLTRRGEHVMTKLKARNWDLKTSAAMGGAFDMGLAIALFGTAALVGSTMTDLQAWYPRQTTGDASGGCGTARHRRLRCGRRRRWVRRWRMRWLRRRMQLTLVVQRRRERQGTQNRIDW